MAGGTENNTKHHKIICLFELDIGPVMLERAVECNSTLGLICWNEL
jgi:hypothetical protein